MKKQQKGLWKPGDKPLDKYERHKWNTRDRNTPRPSKAVAMKNTEIAQQKTKEEPIIAAYEAVLASIGHAKPDRTVPVTYYSVRNDGHPNVLDVKRPGFDRSDPEFIDKAVEWINAEADVKRMPCKGCKKDLPLIMRLDHLDGTLRLWASIATYCTNRSCLQISPYKTGPFRYGRIYRGIFS